MPNNFNQRSNDRAAHAAALQTATEAPGGAPQINTVSASTYTAKIEDATRYTQFTNGSGCLFTVPTNAAVPIPIGAEIEFEQTGAGTVTVAPAAGVTIHSRGAVLTTAGQYAPAVLKKTGADIWTLTGDIA